MLKNLIAFCFACLLCLNAYAPLSLSAIDYKFYRMIRGLKWEQADALVGFLKYPEMYGHTKEEIYNLVYKESRGKVDAISDKGGIGLTQQTRSAIEALPDGQKYYRYYWHEGRKVWIMLRDKDGNLILDKNSKPIHALHLKRIYRPSNNIRICCQFYRICKDMARRKGPRKLGRITFSTQEVSRFYYVAGPGTFEWRIATSIIYVQNLDIP